MKKTMSFDTMMNAALLEYQKDYMSSLPSKEKLDAAFKPDSGFHERLEVNAKKAAKPKRTALFYLRRTAACFVMALALMTVMFAPVQAVRQAVISTVLEWQDTFTRFVFSTKDGNAGIIPLAVELGYLPEGYENGDIFIHEYEQYLYEAYADDGGMLFIEIYRPNDALAVDNEHSEYFIIEHNGQHYTYVEIDNGYLGALIWTKESLVFRITTTLSLNQALKIAENIFL